MRLRHYYCLAIIAGLVNLSAFVFCTHIYSRKDFPSGFVFGSGSSAYQVEGAANQDGRTPSVWDTFVHNEHWHGGSGDVAADGYHKYKEDVQLMVETGLDAYRFSISWSRLIPNGRGLVNPKGLQYYNNLINELISHGIQPHVTLFHYDHPQALEDEYGGWVSRKIVKDFTSYAQVCFREFGDRVSYWTTLNEANVFLISGYDAGNLPPNRCSAPYGINCNKGNSSSEPYLVAYHMLLSHASAVRLYRKKYQVYPFYSFNFSLFDIMFPSLSSMFDVNLSHMVLVVQGKQHGFIGFNVFMYGVLPLTNSSEDLLAVQRTNDFMVGLMVNPLVFGDYPSIVKKNAGLRLPAFTNYESKQVKGSFDFLGINHYLMVHVKDNPDYLKLENRDMMADMAVDMVYLWNSSVPGFPIRPQGLQLALEYLKQVYDNPPVYIHENAYRAKIIIGRHFQS
ncbi:beta-glucosidase 11-like isoform X3 [Euphorbia lathyris]|uniref:beta-glucosidase 11-like isoform X3 n=1 Tax=Euphorbia lathyris TaxID=212925 RepID=UPI003313BBBF